MVDDGIFPGMLFIGAYDWNGSSGTVSGGHTFTSVL